MKFSISGRGVGALIACAALPLSVAACSPGSTGSVGGSAVGAQATGAAAASPSATDPNAGLPNGTQLKADLVSAGIPKGYALDASGSVDSGADFQAPAAPTVATGCSSLEGTSWVNVADLGSVSFAQNDYIDKNTSEEFAQEVDAFQGTTAQEVMTALSKIAVKCPSFKDSQTSSTVKVSATAESSPGDGAVVIKLSDPRWEGGMTLEAVRVGHSVVTVLSSANSGSAALAKSMASQIAAKLAAGGSGNQ